MYGACHDSYNRTTTHNLAPQDNLSVRREKGDAGGRSEGKQDSLGCVLGHTTVLMKTSELAFQLGMMGLTYGTDPILSFPLQPTPPPSQTAAWCRVLADY